MSCATSPLLKEINWIELNNNERVYVRLEDTVAHSGLKNFDR